MCILGQDHESRSLHSPGNPPALRSQGKVVGGREVPGRDIGGREVPGRDIGGRYLFDTDVGGGKVFIHQILVLAKFLRKSKNMQNLEKNTNMSFSL